MTIWNKEQAENEGWCLFDVDGRLQLLKLDDPGAHHRDLGYTKPKFKSDVEALLYVAQWALQGSKYHYHALELIGTLAE